MLMSHPWTGQQTPSGWLWGLRTCLPGDNSCDLAHGPWATTSVGHRGTWSGLPLSKLEMPVEVLAMESVLACVMQGLLAGPH